MMRWMMTARRPPMRPARQSYQSHADQFHSRRGFPSLPKLWCTSLNSMPPMHPTPMRIVPNSDNTKIRIFTTSYATTYGIPTLWSDHQYRNAMVTQPIGYNQPPHKSYFLGELEGLTIAPPTNTMTGRTEVANGGTITTTDDHLIVCETNDTKVSIQEGAKPYMVTFNVPSWVQGNAASNSLAKPAPTYQYYTCEVTGGGLAGDARLVIHWSVLPYGSTVLLN